MRTTLPVTVLLLALSLSAGPARADDASEAQLQFELGAEMYRQRRLTEALERFLASNRLVPNSNVAFNIAQVYALLDRPIDAYNWYEEHLSFQLDDATRRTALEARDRLARRVALIDVTTAPPGAEIFVDRVELGSVGRAPRRVALPPGQHTILLRLADHREGQVPVTVAQGEIVSVPVTLPALVGTVRIESFPPGAAVRLEGPGTDLGRTPFETTLPVGEARLTVTLPGHAEQSRTVVVRDGETARLSVRLAVEAATVASLTVSGAPEGAEVLVEGRPLGQVPLTRAGLPPGSIALEVRSPGRDPWGTRVLLEAGAATRVRVRLVGDEDRAAPGWRWLGLGGGGALFLAGTTVGLLAVSEHASFEQEPTRASYDRLGSLNVAADVLMLAGAVIAGTTLVLDLASGPALVSEGQVSLDR